MQSKTSFFNGTLFRKNLSRFWPLWGMASFLGALFPLAMLLQLTRGNWEIRPVEVTEGYYNILCIVPVISLLYAILCAMVVWSYLYNTRSVGLMHTLPIRRDGLFVTSFLSGMTMMLIPYAVVGTLCVLISLAYGGFEPVGLLVTILGVAGESFFYFASATLVAFVTGNIFALPALYFLLHFLATLLDWLLSMLAGNFLFGLSSGYSGMAEWLSPTVYLVNHVNIERTYTEVERVTDMTGAHWTQRVLTAVELENSWLIGAYALVGAAFLAVAFLLYRRRRSESAGDVVAVGWMKPVFRYGVAALAALLGGQLLYTLFWEQFQEGYRYDALPMAVCMIVAGAIGWYAASMLLAKSLRVFRGSWKGIALVAVGCAAVCGVLHFDILGISARVPEISEIREARLYVADNNYTFYPGEENALLEQVREVHRAIVNDREYAENIWNDPRRYIATANEEDYTYEVVRLTYTLHNGTQVTRSYDLCLTRDRMAQSGTYDSLLDRLVNSEAMRAKRLHVGDSRYIPDNGWLYLDQRGDTDLSSRESAAVLEALGKDAAAGTWGTYEWFDSEDGSAYAMSLELRFVYRKDQETSYDWISITLRPGMVNTIACLKELGLVTEEDLVTYAELYPEQYQEDYDTGKAWPTAADTAVYEAKSAAGIIGGADGPAMVVVS